MRKLKSKKGMTMVEMLCVLVITVLVSATLVTGIQLGLRSYQSSMMLSKAKVLCSTLSIAVRDELRYATNVKMVDGQLQFFDNTLGNGDHSYFSSTPEGYLTVESKEMGEKRLISNASYGDSLSACLNRLEYNETTGIFHVQIIVLDQDGNQLAESEFQVKCLKH